MSIEIRRMSVRCQVVVAPAPPPPAPPTAAQAQELRTQLLAQCRAWLRDELRRAKER